MSARVYRRRRIAAGLGALLVLGLAGLAGGWGYTAFRFGQISSVHVPGLGKAPPDGSLNLLVVGSDIRQGLRDGGFGEAAGQRSDVIMVVHLVPDLRHAAVMSIPRDLYVPVAGTGRSAKINSAFNRGPGQLVQTIRESFGIPIHHYLLVDFDGFREAVDALGGVAMYFPRPARDDDGGVNLSGLRVPKAGCRQLDGDQALALARSRYYQYQDGDGRWHGDPAVDLGRIRRQQTLLRALAAKAAGGKLANPVRANALVGSVVRSLTKDDRLTLRRAVSLARRYRSFDPTRMSSLTLPVDRAVQRDGVVHRTGQPGFEEGIERGWEQVLLPRQPDAGKAMARLLSRPSRPPPPAPPTTRPPPRPAAPGKVSVTVGNGTTRQGLAAKVTAGLHRLGFRAANGGNARPAGATTVRYAPGKDAAGAAVARAVKAGRPVRATAKAGLGGKVELVLGTDFRGLASKAAVTRPPAPRPARPPAPTPATRGLPAWDPRPC